MHMASNSAKKTPSDVLTIINSNRQDSTIDFINYDTQDYELEGYKLNDEVFDQVTASFKKDPALTNGGVQDLTQQTTGQLQPDMAVLVGSELYMSARGPKPVSAVMPGNMMPNAKPGAMMVKIDPATCKPTKTGAFALPVWERSPEITADVHGIWSVTNGGRTEIWAVDQARTGSVQSFDVYSSCAHTGATLQSDPVTR